MRYYLCDNPHCLQCVPSFVAHALQYRCPCCEGILRRVTIKKGAAVSAAPQNNEKFGDALPAV